MVEWDVEGWRHGEHSWWKNRQRTRGKGPHLAGRDVGRGGGSILQNAGNQDGISRRSRMMSRSISSMPLGSTLMLWLGTNAVVAGRLAGRSPAAPTAGACPWRRHQTAAPVGIHWGPACCDRRSPRLSAQGAGLRGRSRALAGRGLGAAHKSRHRPEAGEGSGMEHMGVQ